MPVTPTTDVTEMIRPKRAFIIGLHALRISRNAASRLTWMTDALNEAQKAAILSRIPAGAMGTGEDIGAGVVYLASREAGYVTGQTLHVNGGMAMP